MDMRLLRILATMVTMIFVAAFFMVLLPLFYLAVTR